MKFGSCATGVCEPCQVGNKAALNRISRVPQGCLAELTVEVTDTGGGSKSAAWSLKMNDVYVPGEVQDMYGSGLPSVFLYTFTRREGIA